MLASAEEGNYVLLKTMQTSNSKQISMMFTSNLDPWQRKNMNLSKISLYNCLASIRVAMFLNIRKSFSPI